MKTYKKDVDLFLVDGEVSIVDVKGINGIDIKGFDYPVIYSTRYHNITGVKSLDRSKFIKPVNVESKALEIFEKSHLNLSTDFITGFKAGYNENKAEYTREDMDIALAYASMSTELKHRLDDIKRIFYSKYPKLSLPESITIDYNDEIIEVVW